jgi:hypothetical protein
MMLLTPKGFLLFGGIILVALAVLGVSVLGPNVDSSALGSNFWLDGTENILHLLFGVVALAAYFLLKDANLQKWLVVLVFVIALAATVVGVMNSSMTVDNTNIFGIASTNLENPLDNVLHGVVALWAAVVLYKSFMSKV